MAGPLKGLKILDFTTLLPGPYATMMLADMGADVLRVISKTRADPTFFLPPLIAGTELSAAAAYLGRGKKSLTLNLKDSRAFKIIRHLIGDYDIVIEQFRPGVMEKLGLDYAALNKENPNLIYCSLTGYGQNGPLRNRAGHDINYLARSGIMSYSGRKETGPTPLGVQLADITCGSHNAVMAILAAIVHRQTTGQGQYLDVAMTDGALALHALFGACFLVDGILPAREENILNGGCLYDIYETGDAQHISFGPLEAVFFEAFCTAVGRPDLMSGGIAPQDGGRNKTELANLFRTKSRDEWIRFFSDLDVCVEPVMTMREVIDDPQTKERRMIVDVPLSSGRTVRQFAHPVKFSQSKPEYKFAGVLPGAHNQEILTSLGYTQEEIEAFAASGLFD